MGGSMAAGMAAGTIVSAGDIAVADKSPEALDVLRRRAPGIRMLTDNREAARSADLIIVAVKPWLLETVAAELRESLDYTRQSVASVVAGVDFAALQAMFDNHSGVTPVLYRVIPNTAISIGESVTFIASQGASEEAVGTLVRIFGELGQATVISEKLVPAATSLASCGIAFALRYMRDSMQGGVDLGFTHEQSREIVMQTVRGALEMLRRNGSLPQAEIDKVTTPGGITLKGLAAMDEAGFSEAVLAGLFQSR